MIVVIGVSLAGVLAPRSRSLSCLAESSPVKVVQKPIAIRRRLCVAALPAPPLPLPTGHATNHGATARTDWFFHCYCDVDYDVIRTSGRGRSTEVALKIRSATMTVGLDVTVWLSRRAVARTVSHEEGHVEIVRRLYEKSPQVARKAAESVVGQVFIGRGENLKSATSAACGQAMEEACRRYRSQTVDVASAVSACYESIEDRRLKSANSDRSVDLAFASYQQQAHPARQ